MSVIERDKIGNYRSYRDLGKDELVFTNGCFDLVHAGHVHLLREASRQGDYLLVGLNSDDSIRRIKGDDRPVLGEDDRGRVVDSLQMVDDVVFFDEDTPKKLIQTVHPDVIVKGEDYELDEIVGAEFVRSRGGRVVRVELIEGKGTSQIIEQIREQ